MASFNLTNVFFFCFFVYIKSVYSTSESLVALQSTEGFLRYTFKDGVKCLGVEYDGMKVLDLDPASQPESVVFSVEGSTALLDFGTSFDALKLDGSALTSVFSGEPTGRTVNVLYKKEGDHYLCKNDGKVYTYKPKDKGLFNKVRYQPSRNIEIVLYEAKDKFEMATMVEYQEMDAKNQVVSVYCVDGSVKAFSRRNGGNWTKVPPKESLKKLSADKLEFTVLCHDPKGVKFDEDSRYLKYGFENGFKCFGVEYDGKEVMKFDPEKPLPKSLFLTTQSNAAILNFEKSMDIFRLDGNTWKSVYSGKPKADELDIVERQSNGVFQYSKNGQVHTYTAVEGHSFGSIKKRGGCFRGEKSVWSAHYLGDVANKVVYDNRNSNVKFVTVYGLTGVVKKFVKNGNGVWKEVTAKDTAAGLSKDKVEFVMKVTPESEVTVEESVVSEEVQP